MKIKGFNSFLNEKVDIDLLAVDMIDYYGNEIPKSSEDSDDFAKSRDLKDRALIKKIWDRAKEIQKEGISEAVSPERMAAKAKKMADAKKSVVNLLDHFSKIVSKENDPEKVEDAFYALETLVNGYVDIMKTAP
jgi:hypothetical protein